MRRHFNRVISYTRPSDWWKGAGLATIGPGLMLFWERVSPSYVGKGGFAGPFRLSGAIGLTGAFYWVYQTTSCESTIKLPFTEDMAQLKHHF